MHILVVEALLIAIYSTWERANTYTHKKTLSVENLSRANSWSLSSCACSCPAGSCPAGSLSSWPIPAGVYEPANSNRNAAYSQQLPPKLLHRPPTFHPPPSTAVISTLSFPSAHPPPRLRSLELQTNSYIGGKCMYGTCGRFLPNNTIHIISGRMELKFMFQRSPKLRISLTHAGDARAVS